ncbi:putative peptidylprolyl isomerase [Medicago truncatula]|uniref:peptidylprolyl isomerase n=1 Tax=Medicago truncatula TaxID=3880 RepID=A0A396GBJ7_MEDTR|nr:putative peptidylprolyl isomerase [Medicago truncatula]
MNKGENTIFIIPPGLACGKSTLPPVTSSQFDICKDGGLLKKILKEGKKWENSKDPDDVIGMHLDVSIICNFIPVSDFVLTISSTPCGITVKYEARLYDGTLVAKSDKVEFTVEDGHCIQLLLIVSCIFIFLGNLTFMFTCYVIGHCCLTLPKTVKNMKKGEKVILTVRPQYGLGEKGLVPPNAIIVSTMYYQVERVSFLKDMWSWEMNTEEKIKVARKKKIVGNKLKFDKKFARASEKYEKVFKAKLICFTLIHFMYCFLN